MVPNGDHNEVLRDEEVITTILAYAIDDFVPPAKKLKFRPMLNKGARLFDGVWRRPPLV